MQRTGKENADRCAGMRSRVHDLALTNWNEALKVANEIPLPWYRVQALAVIAKAAPNDRVDSILTKALNEAEKGHDEYCRGAVLAWVLGAAISRQKMAFAQRVLRSVLAQSCTITPLKSRAAALELLLVQATKLGESEARRVADALLDAADTLQADPFKKWRKWGVTYVNRTAYILSRDQPTLLTCLLTSRYGTERCVAIIARHSKP